MKTLALAWRLARRELRSGLSGFRIFFASLVLGVMAIAAVGSLADALLTGLADNGRGILGGDVAIGSVNRPLMAAELGFVRSWGNISQTVSMRAMTYALTSTGTPYPCLSWPANAGHSGEIVTAPGMKARSPRTSPRLSACHLGGPHSRAMTSDFRTSGTEPTLIELKAVDSNYPLYGSVGLSPHRYLSTSLACDANDICGVVVEQSLLDRLHLAPGDQMRIGAQGFRVAAVLIDEPDRLSGGFSLGPHVIVSLRALQRTGLMMPGSLIEYETRIRLPGNGSIAAFRHAAKARFPNAGLQIRDRDHAARGTDRFIRQISIFLTLVGLTALAIGGVGAGQAVRAFLDHKREEIATLKALGADGTLIFLTYLLQVMSIATVASVVGTIAGAVIPFAVQRFYGTEIPVPANFALFASPLLLAFIFGMLSAAAFGIVPLARAREIPPASLFRDLVAPTRARGRLPYLAAAGCAGLLIVALALAVSPSLSFSVWFLVCTGGALIALSLASASFRFAIRRLPAPSRPGPRLALANLTRPGSGTTAVITALGLGLSLLATVTILDRTISAQVDGSLPKTAPSFYFVDIQSNEAAAFDRTIARFPRARDYRRSPMIRGRIVAIAGVPAARARVAPSARWALDGDRGITYAATEPQGTTLTAGRWWPQSYRGATLISLDADVARGMGLKIGDAMTLNVLGRDIEGRIANLRDVDFSTGRQNFALILSPGVIDRAPHSFLATVRVPSRDEEPMYRAVTAHFPSVSVVRVKDVIGQLDQLLQKLAFGVRAASLVAILAGLLVLAGAIAAGLRARLYDSTIMKVVGATRFQVALVYGLEFALIGALTGTLALGAGLAAATVITRRVFEIPPVLDWDAALFTVAGGALLTLAFGLAITWAALAVRPAEQLRNL